MATSPEIADTVRMLPAYGWCGLCYSFTDFPHNCPGEGKPVDEEAA